MYEMEGPRPVSLHHSPIARRACVARPSLPRGNPWLGTPVSRAADPAGHRSPGSRRVPAARSFRRSGFPILRSPACPVLLRPKLPPVRTPRRSDDVFLL